VISCNANCTSVWANHAGADDSQNSGSLRVTAFAVMVVSWCVSGYVQQTSVGVTSVEIALNGKSQFLTWSTRMHDLFILLENHSENALHVKQILHRAPRHETFLTIKGTAIPEQPRQ
jgi:hypothetical protein